MKIGNRVRARSGSGAADVRRRITADGIVHVVVLMDEEGFTAHWPAADWIAEDSAS